MTDRIERSGKGRRRIGLWLEGSGFELKEKRRQYDRRNAVSAEMLVDFMCSMSLRYIDEYHDISLIDKETAQEIIDFIEKGK